MKAKILPRIAGGSGDGMLSIRNDPDPCFPISKNFKQIDVFISFFKLGSSNFQQSSLSSVARAGQNIKNQSLKTRPGDYVN